MRSASSEPAAGGAEETRCCGLLRRQARWGLTRRGWVMGAFTVFLLAAIWVHGIHSFLAVNDPVPAEVLVVEGWVPDYALAAAFQEFQRGDYRTIYVTGVPIERGAPLSEYKNYAALGAAVLRHFGANTNEVQAVPAPAVRRDRTYASALAVKDWLARQETPPEALNVVTVGLHARRSRLLYEEAFGEACQIGVIAIEDEGYDPRRWWAYSEGVRTVMSETAAYLYARFFFSISAERRTQNESGEDSVESSP